jgi:RNA polymerase sigma factor for flagellar operon FliA
MATQVVVPGKSFPGAFPASPFGPALRYPERLRPRTFPPFRPHARPRSSATTEQLTARRNQLVLTLLPLVKRVAYQMRERLPLHVELDDLVSSGVLGLVDAVRKFDGRRHVTLDRYARHRIRGAILDGLRSLDTASRDMRKKNRKAEKVYRQLELKLGRPPGDAELAMGLGMSLDAWYRAVRELQTVGMDWLRPLGSVGMKEQWPAREESLAADNDGHQFDTCYRREQREILDRALTRIPERERQVVQLYYQQQLTMKEIGKKLRIDESRVSQLHSAALARLRWRVKDILSRPQPSAPQYAW